MREALHAEEETTGSLAQRWEDLNATAVQLAMAADLAPERTDARIARFPAMVGNAHEWQRELAWQGLEDIDAMMRPGLSALSTLSDRGHDATAPALALWREFYRAREAVVSLVDPEESAD
ncbi:MAG: hypothetical protein AAFQ27_14785 [Pseudomonadota bacterium]